MSKPSSSRIILTYLRQISPKPSPPTIPTAGFSSTAISHLLSSPHRNLAQNPISSPWLRNLGRTHFSSAPIPRVLQNPDQQLGIKPGILPNNRNLVGLRFFSLKNQGVGSKGNVKNVLNNPKGALTNVISRYREVVGLQIEAFWKRNYLVVVGAGGILICILLWRIMFGIANTFVGLSEGMAKYGFLALSTAMVAFAGLYLRLRFTINPDKVYRMAMRKLNTSAAIVEVMGAPLTGTDLRAYVMSGGGISLKKFKPRFRSKICFLIFPIRGSERKGLVSVEVKNKSGQYDMKLLAVDIPMATGPDQRLFLVGDDEEYKIGGGLIAELRDPVVKAMAAIKEFEVRDDIEYEEDAEREILEAERRQQEETKQLEKVE